MPFTWTRAARAAFAPLWLLALCLALAAPPLLAKQSAPLPAGVVRVTSVEGVTEYRLDNGLRVLLVPDPTKPSITVNVTYLVGSRHENYGETGMAHLLEHLLFKGTPAHPTLDQEFRQRGMRQNASTSYDRTNYFETFPATGDNLEWALGMEADRMVNSFVARKDLDSEMTVVRNEMEAGENSPSRVLYQRMLGVAYEWHNYGNTTIGARADVENVKIERLQAFYRKYYQPDNAVLIVGGQIDEARTLALVAEAFGRLPTPERVLEPTYTVESVQDGERQVVLRRTADVQYVSTLYHTVPAAHPDYPALLALTEILGDTPSGRLHKALVESGKATSVYGFIRDTREPGHALFVATVGKTDSLDEAKRLLLETVEGNGAQPVSAEELRRVQVAAAKDFEQTIASPGDLVAALSEAVAWGDWRLFFWQRDRLAALTPADVQQVAGKYFKASNRTLGLFMPTDQPDRAPVPSLIDATAVVKDYTGRGEMTAGEAFDPTPQNIEARTTRIRLANGMQLVLLPKKTRGGVVNARLQLHFGDESTLIGKREIGSLAGSMLMRGTKGKTRQQIRDAFDALKADVSIGGDADGAGATLMTTREGLVEALRLVAEVLREPAFPEDELEQLKKQAVTGIDASRREPQAVAGNAVRRHFNRYPPDDIRYAPTFDEQIGAIGVATREQVVGFHREFYGAQEGELAIVGDFDADAITRLATELFGDWTAQKGYERVPQPYHAVDAQSLALETPDKANAVLAGAAAVPVADTDADAMAVQLANFLLGGSETSRLWTRIREQDGLSYDVGSSLQLNPYEANSAWSLRAIFAPENRARLETALREEISRAHRDGFSAEEVEAGKRALLALRRLARTDDGALAGGLARLAQRDRTAEFLAQNDRRTEALTPDEVNAALRKYLRLDALTVAIAGDFTKIAKK